MIDGSVLQSAQRCFEKKSRVVVKMVVNLKPDSLTPVVEKTLVPVLSRAGMQTAEEKNSSFEGLLFSNVHN